MNKEICENIKTELYNNILFLCIELKDKSIKNKKNISESLDIHLSMLNKLLEKDFNAIKKEIKI
jgi:hypothetical protein